MDLYFRPVVQLSAFAVRVAADLDFHPRTGAISVRRVGGDPQDVGTWDRPHSALIETQFATVPPHSRGQMKSLGKRHV